MCGHLLRQSSGEHDGWLLPLPLSSWRLRPYRLHCLYGRGGRTLIDSETVPDLFIQLKLHQIWLLESLCLLLCCQECTTMFVPSLNWWEISIWCGGTTRISYHVVVGLLWLPPWCPLVYTKYQGTPWRRPKPYLYMSLSSAVSILLDPFWFRSSRPLVYTL